MGNMNLFMVLLIGKICYFVPHQLKYPGYRPDFPTYNTISYFIDIGQWFRA